MNLHVTHPDKLVMLVLSIFRWDFLSIVLTKHIMSKETHQRHISALCEEDVCGQLCHDDFKIIL